MIRFVSEIKISLYESDSCMSVSMDDIMKVLPRLKDNKIWARYD